MPNQESKKSWSIIFHELKNIFLSRKANVGTHTYTHVQEGPVIGSESARSAANEGKKGIEGIAVEVGIVGILVGILKAGYDVLNPESHTTMIQIHIHEQKEAASHEQKEAASINNAAASHEQKEAASINNAASHEQKEAASINNKESEGNIRKNAVQLNVDGSNVNEMIRETLRFGIDPYCRKDSFLYSSNDAVFREKYKISVPVPDIVINSKEEDNTENPKAEFEKKYNISLPDIRISYKEGGNNDNLNVKELLESTRKIGSTHFVKKDEVDSKTETELNLQGVTESKGKN